MFFSRFLNYRNENLSVDGFVDGRLGILQEHNVAVKKNSGKSGKI